MRCSTLLSRKLLPETPVGSHCLESERAQNSLHYPAAGRGPRSARDRPRPELLTRYRARGTRRRETIPRCAEASQRSAVDVAIGVASRRSRSGAGVPTEVHLGGESPAPADVLQLLETVLPSAPAIP